MCGICGFNWDDKQLIQKMSNSIKHRGPDQQGYFTDNNVSLGHRRLSIIDLSEKGRQPMQNEDGSVIIIFNGEIYNYREIRKELLNKKHRFFSNSDTEVIIHAYEEYGVGCLDRLNGDFAFCIYDIKNNKLFLARDRLGIKPLYFFSSKGIFVFSSEIKAILCYSEISRAIDRSSLSEFVLYRYTFSRKTLLKGISRVFPGEYLLYDLVKKKITQHKYWDIKISNFGTKDLKLGSITNVAHELRNLFNESVKRRMISDIPVGAYLSGGVDSSAVVASMRMHNSQNEINTYSVGFNLDKEYDELKYARLISEKFDTTHKEITMELSSINLLPEILWHIEEPIADPAAIPNYVLSKTIKNEISVVMTGVGSDEIFGGYEHYKIVNFHKPLSFIPKKLLYGLISASLTPPLDIITKKYFKYPTKVGIEGINRYIRFLQLIKHPSKAYSEIVGTFDEEEANQLLTHYHYDFKNPDFNGNNILNSAMLRDIKQFLPEQVLILSDKMAMAHSVELRVPFIDHKIVEFSATLPINYKLHGFTEKFILKKAFKGIIPKEILQRKKQGFYVPIDIWFNNNLKEVVNNYLNMDEIKKEKNFDEVFIDKIVNNYSSSKLYYAKQLWSLINFQIWKKIFIDEEDIKNLKKGV